MKNFYQAGVMHSVLTVVTGLTAFILSYPVVLAGSANPQTGYESMYDNIMDIEKGPNNGRCNAVGVLGSLICETTGELTPDIRPIINKCEQFGIEIEIPEYCIPVDCEVSRWSPWSACNATTLTQTRTRTITTYPENGGLDCPSLSERQSCELAPDPATISNLRFLEITSSSTTLAWETDRETDAQLEVTNPVTGEVIYSTPTMTLSTQHLATVGGLSANTLYQVRAISTTSEGLVSLSNPLNFQTRRGGGFEF